MTGVQQEGGASTNDDDNDVMVLLEEAVFRSHHNDPDFVRNAGVPVDDEENDPAPENCPSVVAAEPGATSHGVVAPPVLFGDHYYYVDWKESHHGTCPRRAS